MSPDTQSFDVIVIGGGIVGIAHAYAAARRGLSVLLLERSDVPRGASVRNFGLIWPVGLPAGPLLDRALRTRAIWLDVGARAGLAVRAAGSLHLAYRADELAVLEEFSDALVGDSGMNLQMLSPHAAVDRYALVRRAGLLGALWSPMELCVEPIEAIPRLLAWLTEEYRVSVRFSTTVIAIEEGRAVTASGVAFGAENIFVCGGDDLRTLFPDTLREFGLKICKLQMMRTAAWPAAAEPGPVLAGGLTLRHYPGFAVCPSLPALRQRIAAENPELDRFGIHVLAAQTSRQELILGDSHEDGEDHDGHYRTVIERLILEEAARFLDLPRFEIAQRWVGTYARCPTSTEIVWRSPKPGVTIVTGLGGLGMTTAFGWAEEILDAALGGA